MMDAIDGTNVQMAAGTSAVVPATGLTDDNWLNIVVVRTPASKLDGQDTFTLYVLVGNTWVNFGSKAAGYNHNALDSSTLVLGLFGGANGSGEGGKTNVQYDDVRIYNKALTLNDLNTLVTPTSVNMLGAQRSMNTFDNNQSYKVRLVAQINGNAWTDAGFKVTANDGTDLGTQDLKVNVAYTSILAQEDGGLNNVITASEGCYLISIVIEGIPVAKDTLTLTVTPYASDGTTPVEGKAVVITLENAQITSITWAN